jgi:hypothetical protein
MLRLILGLIVIMMIVVSMWGSRDFCDCQSGSSEGVIHNIGWKGVQRISNDVNKRDRLLESCMWVCKWNFPQVDLVYGGSR